MRIEITGKDKESNWLGMIAVSLPNPELFWIAVVYREG